MAITVEAREREILFAGWSAMLESSDVINLMREEELGFRNQAVFAAAQRPLPYEQAQPIRNAHWAGAICCLAWSLSRANK